MVMVLSLTVFVDLITAVVAGVVVAAVAFVKQVADAQLAAAAGENDDSKEGCQTQKLRCLRNAVIG